MSKKKRLTAIEWITSISCGVISFCYFFSIDYNNKIVGPPLNSAFDYVSGFVGETTANIIAALMFFGSGFFVGWIFIRLILLLENKLSH